jgi:anti-anti-sigma factor
MDMQVIELDGATKVALNGRQDTAGAGLIEPRFAAVVVARGGKALIDLTQLSFLASLGVRMLISTARSLAFRGGTMILYGASAPVAEIIETTQLDDIVPVVASEAEALALVRAQP